MSLPKDSYLTVRTELRHLVGDALRENVDRGVLQRPVGVVEAADVEPGGRAAGFDLSQRDLDHRAEAFDLVEKRNAVAHADQTRPETKIIFFGTGSIWQIVSISNKSFFCHTLFMVTTSFIFCLIIVITHILFIVVIV